MVVVGPVAFPRGDGPDVQLLAGASVAACPGCPGFGVRPNIRGWHLLGIRLTDVVTISRSGTLVTILSFAMEGVMSSFGRPETICWVKRCPGTSINCANGRLVADLLLVKSVTAGKSSWVIKRSA
ncbi:hypothetical protein [Streptomyces sp. NPDC020362]|uniref:hypothetical protein n=1 Tax=unclassified Streptomyces TaxID=2593676 RepID=UPI0033C38CAC